MENERHHHAPPPEKTCRLMLTLPSDPKSCGLTLNLKGQSQHTLNLSTPVAQAVVGSYLQLTEKPRINNVELVGNLSYEDLGFPDLSNVPLVPISIHDLDIITGYASTEASLIDLCSVGGEVCLFNDITLTQPLTITHDTILDLSGSIITSTLNDYLFTVDNCTLTIKGGIITTEGSVVNIVNGGEVIIDNGTFIARDNVFSLSDFNSDLTINDGTIRSLNGFCVYTNKISDSNNITLNNGYLESNVISNNNESCCVLMAGNNTFTMNNGVVKSTDGCGILMRAGVVVVNGGRVTAEKKETGSHSPGYIDGVSTPMFATAIIYDEMTGYPQKGSLSLTVTGGTFIGVDHSLEILHDEVQPVVEITGGTFVPDYLNL